MVFSFLVVVDEFDVSGASATHNPYALACALYGYGNAFRDADPVRALLSSDICPRPRCGALLSGRDLDFLASR
jgi:hypothetical protein